MAMESWLDPLRLRVSGVIDKLRQWTLGDNNERLDFLLDSFYKLDTRQRTTFLGVAGAIIAVLVTGSIGFYFYRVASLKAELNDTFTALHQLDRLEQEYNIEEQRFNALVEKIQKKSSELKLKPFIEKLGREIGIQIEINDEKREPIPVENPLSSRVQFVNADLRLSKVSIPRLLKLISEIERSENLLSIQSLEIKSIYGQKLFFSSRIMIRGYSSGSI